MTILIGRNHRREVLMQALRERVSYKPSVFRQYFDGAQTIFIHIPKCAGTSISSAVYGSNPWHWTASDLHRINRKKYQQYFKFSIVRNPWDRLYSAFVYAEKDVRKYSRSPLSMISNYSSFEHFVMEGITKEIADRHYFLGKQVNYLLLPSGEIDRDIVVGKLENLAQFIGDLSERLPALSSVGRKNVSTRHQSLKEAYTPEMVEHVRKLYRRDVDYFGYDF